MFYDSNKIESKLCCSSCSLKYDSPENSTMTQLATDLLEKIFPLFEDDFILKWYNLIKFKFFFQF